jgi:hypothetical protein
LAFGQSFCGVARIDVVNDDQLVCAAQGTVTIVLPKA